jgi:hypothetical protein
VYARLHSMQLLEGRRAPAAAPVLVEPAEGRVSVAVGERQDD